MTLQEVHPKYDRDNSKRRFLAHGVRKINNFLIRTELTRKVNM